MKFGLKAEFAARTCVVVAQVKLPNDTAVQMGLIIESVEEVVHVPAEEIGPTPEFGPRVDTTYLLGMAKVKGQVKTLLDIDRVAAPETRQSRRLRLSRRTPSSPQGRAVSPSRNRTQSPRRSSTARSTRQDLAAHMRISPAASRGFWEKPSA